MQTFYLGIDASKGYADFIILNRYKKVVVESFQLDDTFDGHCLLYELLMNFSTDHPDSIICAALESTGGYENNWHNVLLEFQGTLNLQTARLNPLGVHHNSKADLKRNVTDKISARNVAEYMIAHPEKVSYQSRGPPGEPAQAVGICQDADQAVHPASQSAGIPSIQRQPRDPDIL